jgi:predicted RNA methylase
MKIKIILSLMLGTCFATSTVLMAQTAAAQKPAANQTATLEGDIKPATRSPDVIFVPTPQAAVERMLELAEIKPGDVVYDLGCGDGRIVVTAAKKYGVKAVGFDIDPERIKESLQNVRNAGVEDLVTIKQADIFTLDLRGANVITLYLLSSLNKKLVPQLEKLKPGVRIVSYSFDMPGIIPEKVINDPHTIYKWVTPLRHEK